MKTLPGIEDKIAFLRRPDTYPDSPRCVETKQTHMSWVFLTETHAWKLKKPVRYDHLDFSTPEARRRNCEREVRLNQRLARDVYLGVAPLTIDVSGRLELDGQGQPVDWLVWMRRLPVDRMLDQLIIRHAVPQEDIVKLASVLAVFYKDAPPIHWTGRRYRNRLAAYLDAALTDLIQARYGLPVDLVQSVVSGQLDFLRQYAGLFDARAHSGKIIDAHGDLRPEHICMEHDPVIIDCLEFNRSLRLLDAASDLSFLALECERLGEPQIGKIIFETYTDRTGDAPPDALLAFYRNYHACIRAKIAIWHLNDEPVIDRTKWTERANQYLQSATRMNVAA